MADVSNPGMTLLAKLGSLAVHADEFTSPDGHQLDASAIRSLLEDPEVSQWLKDMDAMAMLPKKRNNHLGG